MFMGYYGYKDQDVICYIGQTCHPNFQCLTMSSAALWFENTRLVQLVPLHPLSPYSMSGHGFLLAAQGLSFGRASSARVLHWKTCCKPWVNGWSSQL